MRHGPCFLLAALSLTPGLVWGQGDPLGPEFRVNTYTTGSQAGPLQSLERPSLSFDPFGKFVAVWTSPQDGSSYGIFGQRYDDSGAPLGPEFQVNVYTTGSQSLPDVAADPSGNFLVVWASDSQDGSSQGVFGQRYTSSGVPLGPEFRVNTSTTGHQGHPSVAADATGFVVAWHSYVQVGADSEIAGQRFTISGNPVGPEFEVNTVVSFAHRFPSVASDAAGNFVVVWGNMPPGGNSQVLGQRYAGSGAPLGPEFRVNTATTLYQYFPAVASDASGNFAVVWSASGGPFGGGPIDIRGRRYASTGAPLGTEFRVSTTTGFDLFFSVPSVAGDATGNFVVVWDSYEDGSQTGIFGQRYENTGAPLGPGFRVNTYATTEQDHPDVASDSAGRFVVVWRSNGQDGSGNGVFGQRYSMIVPVELMRYGVE